VTFDVFFCDIKSQIVILYIRPLTNITICDTRLIHEFAQNLISARISIGLTQKELALACKIHQSVVSALENGKRRPTVPQLMQLALILKVPLQRLLTGTDRAGTELPDIALQLQSLGIADLYVPNMRVPGAFRETEDVIAVSLRGNAPPPQIIEAMPAILAWTPLDILTLYWFADQYDARISFRLGWLADIALTIHRGTGFPGGCPTMQTLESIIHIGGKKPVEEDSLGFSEGSPQMPVSARWKMRYPAALTTFQQRAERLHAIRMENRSRALEGLRHF
jgi:transcriptional regulator with XRE-family HTH domain